VRQPRPPCPADCAVCNGASPPVVLRDHSQRINCTAIAQPKVTLMLRRDSKNKNQRPNTSKPARAQKPVANREQVERKTIEQKEREYAELRARIMADDGPTAVSSAPAPMRTPPNSRQPEGLASAPDGTRGFGRGRGRENLPSASAAATAELAVTDVPMVSALDGAGRGSGRGCGRMDPAKLKANITSRQERWQTLQHDPVRDCI